MDMNVNGINVQADSGSYNGFATAADRPARAGDVMRAVEDDVGPVPTVTRRNEQLRKLGDALSELSRAQAAFTETSRPDDRQPTSGRTAELVNSLSPTRLMDDNGDVTKAGCEAAIQLVKAQMDRLNNDSQSDMTRLQVLVNLQRLI